MSGTNTGDQDVSALATKTALEDSTTLVRSEIPDVSGFLSSESDPTFTSSEAANITSTDITNLGNLSGTNTGDQDVSALATKTALGDSTALVRSEIPDVSGFLSSESDPTFNSSEAANITSTDITNLGNLSGTNTGDQDVSALASKTALGDSTALVRSEIPDVSGFLSSETDPTFNSSEAANISATDITNLGNLSGTNTGDQDVSALASKTALGDSTALVRSEIPDVSGFLSSESDPTFTSSEAANITATDINNLGNLSGTNTGDQDLSALATKTALGDSTALVRSEIPLAADGSETKLAAGINVAITGAGTTASPYIIGTTDTLAIGDSYQGGKIFWLDATGQHGLIAATTDQHTGIRWYAFEKYSGAIGDGLYAGAMNTTLIIATQMAQSQARNFAARYCADYSVTDEGVLYGDWYLPSKYELNLLYAQKDLVGGFASDNYWSSTENSNFLTWQQNFGDGTTSPVNKLGITCSVRAIRSF